MQISERESNLLTPPPQQREASSLVFSNGPARDMGF